MTDRVLPLAGSRNLRDLGGYPAHDGRVVRYGRLLRSGALHALNADGIAYLRNIGLRTICDLRAPDERMHQPTPPFGADVLMLAWDDAQDGLHRRLAEHRSLTGEDGRQAMLRTYEQLPWLHADKFRAMFRRIVDGGVPMLLHCAAGKDRTGVAAALILAALGVERPVIVQDYALSEQTMDYLAVFRADAERDPDSAMARYMVLADDFVAAVLRSAPEYLEHALTAIDRRHGSVETFLRVELGVTDADQARMRALLLQ